MPSFHENSRILLHWLALLTSSCLLLTTCGSGNHFAQSAPPSPRAKAPATRTVVVVTSAAPVPVAHPAQLEPVEPPAAEAPATGSEAEALASIESIEPHVDPEWQEMTPQERATRLQLEGLEFEANRLSAGFEAPEEIEEEAEEPTLLEELSETPIPDDYSIADSREEILRRTQSDLPLVLNSQVIKLINYFSSGRGVKTYRATMGRGAAYKAMVEKILEEEEVPKEFFHLAQAESGFMTRARSWARATGMWQFVSYRGRQYGLRQDKFLEERYDPEKATRAAARHLKDLYIEFGDWYLTMAAYNSGPERVRRAIRRSGSRDYWELCDKRLLPRETRNYIPIILAFTYLTKNQQLYDLGEMDPAPALSYDTVPTHSEVSLQLAADLTGSTVETLKQLNPALLRSATPPFDYDLRLPDGTADEFVAELARIPEDKRAKWRRPEIGEGETLASLAKQYRVKEADIAELNDLEGDTLTLGAHLTIPAETKLEIYGGGQSNGPAGGLTEGGSGRYRIGSGDTLGSIARRFGVSVKQLMAWNGLSTTRIRAGRYVMVRPGGGETRESGDSEVATNSAAPSGRYTVRRGDNLTEIATRHGVTVSTLKSWNSLRGGQINIGQVLRVPGRSQSQKKQALLSGGTYRIQRGDNLAEIADRFSVTVSDLKSWNKISGTRITAGDSLIVGEPSGSRPAPRSASAAAPEKRVASRSSDSAPQRHKVQRGDNLATIAEQYGVSVADLKAWNKLKSSRIVAGDFLTVRGSAAPAVRVSTAPPPIRNSEGAAQYRIQRGDTLEAIAKRFGVTIDQLKSWNGLRSTRIHEGDFLTVNPEAASRNQPRVASIGGF